MHLPVVLVGRVLLEFSEDVARELEDQELDVDEQEGDREEGGS